MDVLGTVLAAVFAAVALGGGAVLSIPQVSRYRRMPKDAPGRKIVLRFTVRRVGGSVVMAVVAVLVFLGVTVINFRGRPALWGWYWLGVIVLLLWLIALGLIDLRDSCRHLLSGSKWNEEEKRRA